MIKKCAKIALIASFILLLAIYVYMPIRRESSAYLSQLEEVLKQAAVSCYATEGAYPPSLEYITERYGIIVDKKQCTVIYIPTASNLMPEITVLENKS